MSRDVRVELALHDLSESQKICLRLVRAGQTSKQIARETGLAPQTVDVYMSRAVATLKVANRHKAAECLAFFEGEAIKVSKSRSSHLAEPQHQDASSLSSVHSDGIVESQKTEGVSNQPRRFRRVLDEILHVPPIGGERHAFDWVRKTVIIIRISLLALVSVSALVAIIRGAAYFLQPE